MSKESAGGVVVGGDGKIVLVHQHNNSWSLPKGGVEEGESALEAAHREIREETGITSLELISELGVYERYSIAKDGVSEDTALGPRKRIFFLFKTSQTTTVPQEIEGEISAVRWVTIEDALSLLTHPKDKEFLKSVREKIQEVR